MLIRRLKASVTANANVEQQSQHILAFIPSSSSPSWRPKHNRQSNDDISHLSHLNSVVTYTQLSIAKKAHFSLRTHRNQHHPSTYRRKQQHNKQIALRTENWKCPTRSVETIKTSLTVFECRTFSYPSGKRKCNKSVPFAPHPTSSPTSARERCRVKCNTPKCAIDCGSRPQMLPHRNQGDQQASQVLYRSVGHVHT